MNKYGQYCPIAKALDLVGDRWTLLIVRDLLGGERGFNDLERGLPGIPRALLAGRLRRLEHDGVVARQLETAGRTAGYRLTEAGMKLSGVLDALTVWGAEWAFGEPEPADLDPLLLLWWMRDGVYKDRLPAERIVAEFRFQSPNQACYWLVLRPEDVSLCLQHPAYDVDVLVRADLSALYQVWVGRITWGQALYDQRIVVEATPSITRDFPTWFALSPVAGAIRTAMTRGPGSA
jgi:DNA-binding HxlR family transcriptional regulator